VKVGDRVIVHFTNNLPISASIHWHGVESSGCTASWGDSGPVALVPELGSRDRAVQRLRDRGHTVAEVHLGLHRDQGGLDHVGVRIEVNSWYR
jgi:FtsP/CotA-like multicopper oxidase with cupredoxin domain